MGPKQAICNTLVSPSQYQAIMVVVNFQKRGEKGMVNVESERWDEGWRPGQTDGRKRQSMCSAAYAFIHSNVLLHGLDVHWRRGDVVLVHFSLGLEVKLR